MTEKDLIIYKLRHDLEVAQNYIKELEKRIEKLEKERENKTYEG